MVAERQNGVSSVVIDPHIKNVNKITVSKI